MEWRGSIALGVAVGLYLGSRVRLRKRVQARFFWYFWLENMLKEASGFDEALIQPQDW